MSYEELVEDERTDSVPRVTPEYADPEIKELGERLAALYAQREDQPSPQLTDEISRIKSRMRKGPRLHAGEFLQDGRYRLVARTHRGSGDEYWKAWDRASNELALVRVFHGSWVTDPEAVRAFLSRGDALERLVHPGIGGVVDANRSDEGFVYLATRYYTTGDLTTASLDTIDAIQVAIEIAQALKYAHDHGVVHGDLRPVNVLLSDDGSAHVVGFTVEPEPTADGATSLFRAPETTEPGYVAAPPADVYALGMTALAILNRGSLPYWVIRDPGRLIRSLPVPDPARTLLARATDWDLAIRYPTMAAMLEDWLSDPDLLSQLATRALERNRPGVAAAHYETLLTVQPSRAVEIRVILGDVYISTGAYDQALEHLLVALERTSDVEALFERLSVVGKHTGQWRRIAETLWNQARIRDAGRRVVLRMELARINEAELHDPMAAAETWTQVLSDHRVPEQAEKALRALINLARAREDWASVVEHTKELLDYVSPEERARLQYAIGRTYLEKLDDEDQGLAYIELGEAASYHELDLSNRLQAIRARRGQWRKVIQGMVLQAAAQDIAEASPTLLRAGIIASSVHLEEDAFTVYHALLERAPKHVVALRHVARMHHRAREYDRAVRFYERLWDTYKGKESEEPEASERAADCTAYAQLLLKGGKGDDAAERLTEALRLNPNHVPALQLAGPLLLTRGDTAGAGAVTERLLTLFKSVELSPQKIEACLGMGELAWVQGRLTAAMGWFNRALELDPFSVPGWWGLAKVALAARGGHPGSDRAPWVMATPKRFTAFEGLARLLAGVLDPAAARGWLELTPLGMAMVEGGDGPVRLACSVVDVLARSDLLTPELFTRLTQTWPEWREPIGELQHLWTGGAAATSFVAARSYAWSRSGGRAFDDFDPHEVRSVLPAELALPPLTTAALGTEEAWKTLFSGAKPAAPEALTPPPPKKQGPDPRNAGPVGALVRDGSLWLALFRDQVQVGIGSAEDNALRITDDSTVKPQHARLFRQGGRIYVEALGDSKVQVDGEARGRWRLIGGERVTLGETRLQFQVFEDETRLPPPSSALARSGGRATQSSPPPAGPRSVPPPENRARATAPPEPPKAEPPKVEEPPKPPVEGAPTPQPEPVKVEAPKPEPAPPSLPPTPLRSSPPSLPPAGAARSAPSLPPGPPESPRSLPPTRVAPAGTAPRSLPPMSMTASRPPSLEPQPAKPPTTAAATRLLEPTAALRIDPAALLAEDDDDDESPHVALAEVAVQPGTQDSDVTVAYSRASDLEAEPGIELPALDEVREPTMPLPAGVVHEDTVDQPPDDEPSEDEVIEPHAPNGVGRVVARLGEPDAALPIPAEELPTLQVPPVWVRPAGSVEDDEVSADNDDDEAPPDQTTTIMPRGPASAATPPTAPDAVPTVVDSVPGYSRPLSDGPSEVDSAFGFHNEPEVPKPQPTGPTAVPIEREALPAPSLPPTSVNRPRGSLEFMSGPDRGRRIEVGEQIAIGQSRQCGVSIPSDLRLSPVHCRVERTRDGFVLTDESSANGTVVNGQRVSRFPLHGGEVIMVGRTVLRFRLERA
jgi:tetratricopeptide (TPR) repeat protein/pSer/pThr/pTyr-binding forkhead associated (FHA) protein